MKTSTEKTEANRHNARRSTGPRTPAGKAASSRNAIRTGLTTVTLTVMPDESEEDLQALQEAVRNEWKPSGDHESFLVDQMISARWRLERIARWEADALDTVFEGPTWFIDKQHAREFEEKSADRLVLEKLDQPNNIFDKLERYARSAERAYSKAVKELQQHRADAAQSARRNQASEKQNKAKEAEAWLRAELAKMDQRPPAFDPMAGSWVPDQIEADSPDPSQFRQPRPAYVESGTDEHRGGA